MAAKHDNLGVAVVSTLYARTRELRDKLKEKQVGGGGDGVGGGGGGSSGGGGDGGGGGDSGGDGGDVEPSVG